MSPPNLSSPRLMSSNHSNSTADSIEITKKSKELDHQLPQIKSKLNKSKTTTGPKRISK